VKIKEDPIFQRPEVPDLEAFSEGILNIVDGEKVQKTQQAINNFTKKISQTVLKKLIYDEAKFISFIEFCQTQDWIDQAEAEKCLEDLQKESPQEFLTLFTKTEAIAAPGWMLPALYEFIISGDNNAAIVYALGSATRATGSYYLSEGVVENRKLLAAGEAIPHIGRASIFVLLAEEHPQLARMLWAYRSCRALPQKAEKETWDPEKARKKFERKHQSPVINFLVDPKDTTNAWLTQSAALNFSLQTAQVLGLK
jgi:hypothetical protein